ncbi:MAG: hypothetical protein AABX52_02215 [Nanoarchaeota archaeon]
MLSKGSILQDGKIFFKDKYTVVLFVCFLMLSWYYLDNVPSWRTETETLNIARTTALFGYPASFDGRNHVAVGGAFDDREIVYFSPWLQFYLPALYMRIAGNTSPSLFVMRSLFVIFGVLSLILTSMLCTALTGDSVLRRVVVFLMTFNLTYLYHIRQARYYSISIFFMLLSIYLFFGFLDNLQKWKSLVVSLILLFHSNWFIFGTTYMGLFIVLVMNACKFSDNRIRIQKKVFGFFIVISVIVVIFTAPLYLYLKPYSFITGASGGWLGRYMLLKYILLTTHLFIFPIFLLLGYELAKQYKLSYAAAVSLIFGIMIALWTMNILEKEWDVLLFVILVVILVYGFVIKKWFWDLLITPRGWIGIFVLANISGMLVAGYQFYDFRYAVQIIPLVFIFGGHIFVEILHKNPIAGKCIVGLLGLTNLLSIIIAVPMILSGSDRLEQGVGDINTPLNFRLNMSVPVLRYLQDESHVHRPPVSWVACGLLKKQASENDTVLMVYDDGGFEMMYFCPEYVINAPSTIKAYNRYFLQTINHKWVIAPRPMEELFVENYTVVDNATGYFIDQSHRPDPWSHVISNGLVHDVMLYRLR